MKVVNFFAGPAHGKSTLAAGLFYEMKVRGYKVELVTEYAKDLIYENRNFDLEDQLLIFLEQYRRLKRLKNNVDYVITDSPLLNSLIYDSNINLGSFNDLVVDIHNSFDNFNIFIENPTKSYKDYGRIHNKEESKKIHFQIKELLNSKFKIDLVLPNAYFNLETLLKIVNH